MQPRAGRKKSVELVKIVEKEISEVEKKRQAAAIMTAFYQDKVRSELTTKKSGLLTEILHAYDVQQITECSLIMRLI